MVTILARFRILPGKEAEAEEAIKNIAANVEEKEDGARTYIFHRDADDPLQVTVFEIWRDQDTLSAHGGMDHMKDFNRYFSPAAGPVFDASTVSIKRMERIAGFSR